MNRYKFWGLRGLLIIAAICLCWTADSVLAKADKTTPEAARNNRINRITQAEREAAADRLKAQREAVALKVGTADAGTKAMAMPMPGTIPDYFGVANWAYSPPLRKFVDTLPGLTAANSNNLGQYLPVGVADTNTYPGSDYYEIAVVQYTEQMHSDLPETLLRGYVQLNDPANPATRDAAGNVIAWPQPHYLGPVIVAQKNRPVRIKFYNLLPTGEAGNLFIPVDTTVMGSGMGPAEMLDANGMPMLNPDGTPMMEMYTQNRATLHLHGGRTVWISDGTPHQWITPAGEMTSYPEGVSVVDVPDMATPEAGTMTFFYSNQQSARLMFYHDHAYGITRLNVYAGEAAGYVIEDQTEKDLVNAGLIPAEQVVLIIQDKTFVDADTIMATDPTWSWGSMPGMPMTGDLWMPHVYVPAQNPYDISGTNPYGRWHYGPWFWPPTTNITYPPVENPYYDPNNAPWEPPFMPGTPHPSMGMESFFDTPVINGTAYPTVTVEPKAYRFRILNAANDRFWNLQLYVADPCVITSDGRTDTEVKMIPAYATAGFPEDWPTDGREGGVPDPCTAGPAFIQIATEGGFLPAPVVIPNQPITWNMDPTTFNFGNVDLHSLLLGCAERADVIIDFSAFAGKTLILYNDAPAAFPALDPRYDYYTGAPDLTDTGGHSGTLPGFGPNTRTIMQIKVANNTPAAPFDLAALQAEFTTTATHDGVFKRGQDPIIVGQTAYNKTYNTTFPTRWPTWGYSRIQDNSLSFRTVAGSIVTVPMEPKAIQDEMGEAFDRDYGRMSGMLGLELPSTVAGNQNFMLYPYPSPPVEIIKPNINGTPIGTAGDGIQIWKITHNGVDTHPIHFHLYDVQLINRVGWDGAIRLPDRNELGWKDTVRVSPLEDTIVGLRAIVPTSPFKLPNSVRLLDPTMPEGATLMGGPGGFVDPSGEPVSVINHLVNYGWEYVWHCHILSHEEMDMMHAVAVAGAPDAPSGLAASQAGGNVGLTWVDNSLNETGFTIQRAEDAGFTTGLTSFTVGADATTFTDTAVAIDMAYYYKVAANNVVGDTTVYPAPAIGFPNVSADSAFSNTASATVLPPPPAAPTNLTATAVAGSPNPTVTLTWTDNANNEAGFTIQRATNSGFSQGLTTLTVGANAAGGATQFIDTTAAPSTRYYYRVRASNGGGVSIWSNTVTIQTPAPLPTPPAAPTNLTFVRSNNNSITIGWTDNANNEQGFYIERSTAGAGGPWTRIATMGTNNTSYRNTGLPRTTTYWYRVQAYNAAGVSTYSNVISGATR